MTGNTHSTIVRTRGYAYSLAFKRPVLGLEAREGLLFVMTRSDGSQGLGECAPWPLFDGVTIDDAELALSSADGELPGCVRWGLSRAERPSTETRPADPKAVQTAALLWEDASVPFDLRLAELQKAPPPALKLKIARTRDSEAIDLARIDRVRSHLPHTEIRLDANRALAPDDVRRMHAACRATCIAFWEEPCAAIDDLAQLARDGIPIALDESLLSTDRDSAEQFKAVAAAAYILKPSLLGPDRCRELVQHARERSIDVVVSSVFESRIGRSALAAFAQEVAPQTVHGLGTADFLAEDFVLPEANEIESWLTELVAEDWLELRFDVDLRDDEANATD